MVALQKADTNLDVNNLVNCTHCHGPFFPLFFSLFFSFLFFLVLYVCVYACVCAFFFFSSSSYFTLDI